MAIMAIERKSWWEKRLGDGPWPVLRIATHDRAHFDEILAYVECYIWGKEIFPGIQEAEIDFWTEGRIPEEFKGLSGDEILLKYMILPIGIAGGILDEHGTDAPTCAHVAAEVLGISDKPELQKILQFCKRVDDEGRSMPFDLHSLLNDRWDSCDSDEDIVSIFDWAADAIRDYIRGQLKFFHCEKEFSESGKIIEGPIGIATVVSDNSKMNRWIRWKFKSRVNIVIQRRMSGNTVVFTTPKLNGVQMDDIVRMVRMKELMKRGIILPRWQELEISEQCEKCPWWYYSKKDKSQLLNGSLTAPDVAPTVLSLKEVAGAVALASSLLLKPCDWPKCTGQRCDIYRLGLMSCRSKRFSEKLSSSSKQG